MPIPVILMAAARIAGGVAARAGAGAAAGGGEAAAAGGMRATASKAMNYASMMPHSSNEPRRSNFDAGQFSGGPDMGAQDYQQPMVV